MFVGAILKETITDVYFLTVLRLRKLKFGKQMTMKSNIGQWYFSNPRH